MNKQEFNQAVIDKHCGTCLDKETCAALKEFNDSPHIDSDVIPCLVCDLLDIPRCSKYNTLMQDGVSFRSS